MSTNAAAGGQAFEKSLTELLEIINAAESQNLLRCLAADLNSFLMGMSLLSGRAEIGANDVRMLFERFKLTLAASHRSGNGRSDYAPRYATHQTDESDHDTVSREMLPPV